MNSLLNTYKARGKYIVKKYFMAKNTHLWPLPEVDKGKGKSNWNNDWNLLQQPN